jgi:5'(3')-deoxyribonucleotidase
VRVAVDLDNVINNLSAMWAKWLADTMDPNFSISKWTEWDVEKCLTNHNKDSKRVYDYLFMAGSFAKCDMQPGAKTAIYWMLDAGFEVCIASASHPNVVAEKWAWIEKHLPRLTYKQYVPIYNKARLDVDCLIDDGPHNIKTFEGQLPILFDAPWNHAGPTRTDFDWHVHRARNWSDVIRIIYQHQPGLRARTLPPIPIIP